MSRYMATETKNTTIRPKYNTRGSTLMSNKQKQQMFDRSSISSLYSKGPGRWSGN